jgi:hypothetical protein
MTGVVTDDEVMGLTVGREMVLVFTADVAGRIPPSAKASPKMAPRISPFVNVLFI